MKSVTTVFVGSHYEKTGSTVTKYYMAGGQRVAMRKSGVVYWLVGDHAAGQRTPGLGRTSVVANQNATVHSRQLYKPWGESRYTYATLPTKRQYTGQYSYVADFGLYYYVARFYDPYLNRWAQPDTIIPSGVQGLDRYAYVYNNPLRYKDPNGHDPCSSITDPEGQKACRNSIASANGGSGLNGTELSETELWMLLAAVMGESSNGQLSGSILEMIAWVYLNRVSKGLEDGLLESVKGSQSAFACYYSTCPGSKGPAFREKGDKESWDDYIGSMKEWAGSKWDDVYKLVKGAYTDWLKYGTGSTIDPTGGATDIRAKLTTEKAKEVYGDKWELYAYESQKKVYAYKEASTWPNNTEFSWYATGPFDINGNHYWLFFSNMLEITPYLTDPN